VGNRRFGDQCTRAWRALTKTHSGRERLRHFGRTRHNAQASRVITASAVSAPPEINAPAYAACRPRHCDITMRSHDRLFHVGFAPLGGISFVRSANFANHDDGVGVRSSLKVRIASMCFRPLMGSPPMPAHALERPRPFQSAVPPLRKVSVQTRHQSRPCGECDRA
jgi:hypothetical protein